MPSLLHTYRKIVRWPAGHWLFSRLVCFKAPYFSSISPRVVRLEAGRCEVEIRHRRAVTNHIGTVHAIALCNLAELAAGLMTDASLPPGMRWIPRGMTVEYLQKAVGTMHAVATPSTPIVAASESYALPVQVDVRNAAGDLVFQASIAMWMSPKPSRG